jgi:flagellar motor switch protein FliN/FliY
MDPSDTDAAPPEGSAVPAGAATPARPGGEAKAAHPEGATPTARALDALREEFGGDGEAAPGGGGAYRRAIFSVPVEVVVAVGSARPAIGELLSMRRDTVLALDARLDDPVQIMVGDRVIARGELEELGEDGGRLGVRLTEVVDVSDLL